MTEGCERLPRVVRGVTEGCERLPRVVRCDRGL